MVETVSGTSYVKRDYMSVADMYGLFPEIWQDEKFGILYYMQPFSARKRIVLIAS